MGAAMYGPTRCTCWEIVHDQPQQPLRPGLPRPPSPIRLCGDCAYRPHSPERSGEAGYAGDADFLDDLVEIGQPFYCHTGIRRVLVRRHPAGVEVPGHPGDYDPPIHDGVPYKADGSPADLCAGWVLRRAKVLAHLEPDQAAQEAVQSPEEPETRMSTALALRHTPMPVMAASSDPDMGPLVEFVCAVCVDWFWPCPTAWLADLPEVAPPRIGWDAEDGPYADEPPF
ncbi:hypothetical protein GCM10023196_037420 [Actinoallomurus vinaceus]|uniref:Uncharacterized protein n=2 Tax=Actinoallomurus vinaceus TaxID=1080074 RepID=A0ABP8UC64_9ACTN